MTAKHGSAAPERENGPPASGRRPAIPPGARATGPRAAKWTDKRWLLVGAGGLFVLLFVIVIGRGIDGGPRLPPQTVEDAEFVRLANATCERTMPRLRRDRERRRTGDEGREAAVASAVERAADELQRLSGEIRQLPVAPGDKTDVSGWLDDWDAYVGNGRRFADALRRSDEKSYADISAEGSALSERIFAFSEANGLDACIFS